MESPPVQLPLASGTFDIKSYLLTLSRRRWVVFLRVCREKPRFPASQLFGHHSSMTWGWSRTTIGSKQNSASNSVRGAFVSVKHGPG